MSEAIGEMLLPGTYIDVRAEGLIGVSGIASGNVGVVGTANRGPLNQVKVLGSYSEALDVFGAYDPWSNSGSPLSLTRTLEQVFAGGASSVYAVRIALAGSSPMASKSWDLGIESETGLLTLTASSPGTWANTMRVTLTTSESEPPTLTVQYGRIKETYDADTLASLAAAVAETSQLLVASEVAAASAAVVPTTLTSSTTPGGPDGAGVTTVEIGGGLAELANQPVNIVVVGGTSAKDAAATVLTHLEQTENDGRERMAVMGVSNPDPASLIANDASEGSDPRLILVTPGIVADDAAAVGSNRRVELPAAYAAALVAGRLASLPPHISLTNKKIPALGLTAEYSRAQQKRLLLNRVLLLHESLGRSVLKGITTDTGAFKQISVRRIVDYAKAGVRLGANPYIGRLNNSRVRAALKATLDGFLATMVQDEMLTGYTLEVGATRREEIEGKAVVKMALQPTFSIDFVKVIMNLQ